MRGRACAGFDLAIGSGRAWRSVGGMDPDLEPHDSATPSADAPGGMRRRYQDLPEDERERLKDAWREETTTRYRRQEKRGEIGFYLFLAVVLPLAGYLFHYAQVFKQTHVVVLEVAAVALMAAGGLALGWAVWIVVRR